MLVYHNEIETLLKNGKIIIIFISRIYGFRGEVDNGRIYDDITNYDFLPYVRKFLLNNRKSGTSSQQIQ